MSVIKSPLVKEKEFLVPNKLWTDVILRILQHLSLFQLSNIKSGATESKQLRFMSYTVPYIHKEAETNFCYCCISPKK